MKTGNRFVKLLFLIGLSISVILSAGSVWADPVIIDHNCTDITLIPQAAIELAKTDLHIAYGHTSHGSQLTTGMAGLVAFANQGGLGLSLPSNIFTWNSGGSGGALDLRDSPFSGASDLGNPDRTAWATATRNYLNTHLDVNVIIWSWCGQVSSASEDDINTYLNLMSALEVDYPDVIFVYMTGHLDGGGQNGNLNLRNQQIRDYCLANDKILYDFADIESYDPDGLVNYMPLRATDACDYDSDGNGSQDTNWATEWQGTHTIDVDWYSCSSAHSQPLNANRKAYAAWWLWAALAGWNPTGINRSPVLHPIGDQTVQYGQLLEFGVSADDLDAGDVLTYAAGALPSGAAFDDVTRTFRWTPGINDVGDHLVTFSVVDNGYPQRSDDETIAISVTDPANPSAPTASDGDSNVDSRSCFLDTLRNR